MLWGSRRDVIRDLSIPRELRERALFLVRASVLPRLNGHGVSGGRGDETTCSLCMRSIRLNELRLGVDARADHYELHVTCFRAWEWADHEFRRC